VILTVTQTQPTPLLHVLSTDTRIHYVRRLLSVVTGAPASVTWPTAANQRRPSTVTWHYWQLSSVVDDTLVRGEQMLRVQSRLPSNTIFGVMMSDFRIFTRDRQHNAMARICYRPSPSVCLSVCQTGVS